MAERPQAPGDAEQTLRRAFAEAAPHAPRNPHTAADIAARADTAPPRHDHRRGGALVLAAVACAVVAAVLGATLLGATSSPDPAGAPTGAAATSDAELVALAERYVDLRAAAVLGVAHGGPEDVADALGPDLPTTSDFRRDQEAELREVLGLRDALVDDGVEYRSVDARVTGAEVSRAGDDRAVVSFTEHTTLTPTADEDDSRPATSYAFEHRVGLAYVDGEWRLASDDRPDGGMPPQTYP